MKKILLAISIALLAFGCGKQEDPKSRLAELVSQRDKINSEIAKLEEQIAATDTTASTEKPVNVILTEIREEEFNHYIQAYGKVDGDENIGVSSKAMGVVSKILVREGQSVQPGQTLAELDDSILRKSIEAQKSQLDLARTMYQKQKALWDQKIGSEVQYLTAKNNFESLEKVVASLEIQLADMKIKSPIRGTVEEIPIRVGSAIQPGFPAFRIVNFSTIKVVAELAESYSSYVNQGDRIQLIFPDLKKELASSVSFASKFINPTNRTFIVESRIPGGGAAFRANMLAIIKINDYKNPKAFQVPINLVQEGLNGPFIATAREKEGKWICENIPVTKGRIYDGMAEILSGLKTGDRVITSGYQNLKNGQALTIRTL